ncbi:AsmA family protein [Dongia sedimenti]|uniref:AsmA family protein n=1 Tax=Dongia sedimenti TaxID=3064282 RepID=A0ABU0YEG2_9PROT|nr:AsmA family protein [Rhodospirillaceae bacterium R-7]
MKKLLYFVGGIVVLVIAAALIAPFFIDLNDYKGTIEAKAKEATGRDLKIDGKISLSLLPLPSVTVDGIKFGNAPGGTAPNMAEIESAKVKVAVMPLLSDKVQITEITLTRPVIVLEKLKDGTGNWVLKPGAAEKAIEPNPAQPASPSATSSAGGWDVQIDGATVEDGTFIYRDAATGAEQKVDKINVDLSIDSLKGPFDAKGSLVAMNLPLGFSAKTGRMDPSAPMPIEVTLTVGETKGSFGFSGQADMAAAGDPTKPIVTGKLSAKAENVAELMAALSGGTAAAQPPALARPFTLAGDVTAGSAAADIKNLALTLGDIAAQGAVGAQYGEATTVDANLAVGRVDLDKLMPAGKAGEATEKKTEGEAAGGAAKPAAPFTLPAGITANVTATVEQIAYQGKAIDGTKLVAQLKDGALNLTQLSAQLPGNTAFTLSGVLAPKSGQPSFTGALKASSDNLREVADMFAPGALASVPSDRLRKLALTSRLNASPAQVEIADLNATLDASKISGGVILALPDDQKRKRMAFGVGLSVDKLNVDGYLPQSGKKVGEPSTSNDTTKTKAAPDNPLKALAPLGDLDANIEIKAGSLTMNGQQVKGLHALIGLADATLNIKDISVNDLMGGKGEINGKVTDLKGDPKFDINYDISAKDAGKLLVMGGMEPQAPGKFGALTLKGKANGNANDVTYDIAMAMTGVGLDGTAKGTASGLMAGGIPKINSDFDIKAKDTAALAQLFGGPADAAKQLGSVAFKGTAQSGADDLTYDVTLAIGGIGGSGKLAGKVTGISGTPQVDTTLDLKADKPAPLLQLAGLAGPKAQAMGALTAAGALKGNAEDMNLNLDLSAAGATAKVAGNVKMPKQQPIAFDLSITANHPEFTDLMKIADMPASGAKGGPLALAVKAAGTTQKASVSQLDAKWGDSSLAGTANYDATGAKPMITANLSGGTVNLTPFMAPSTKTNASKSTTGSGGSGSPAKTSGPWSTEPLDLSALGKQDADIDFKAKSLIMPDQRIDDLVAKITIKDGLMTMQTLNGKIYGGAFDLSGTRVNGNGTPKIDAKVAVKAIQLAELLGGGIAGSQVKGPISLNFDGTGSGLSQADIVRSLTGKGNLDGTVLIIGKIEQTVGSALLGVLGQKVKQVQGIADKINGVLSAYTGVDNKLGGTFDIVNGVLNTEDTAFTNPKARGTAKGKVDLAQMALSMLIDLFGSSAEQAFMSVNLDGPVSSPKPSFSGGGAAPSASGIPGLNIPGVNLPGFGGSTDTSTEPGGAATGIGGAAGSAVGGAVGGTGGAAVGGAAGGLINDLLGGKDKKKKQEEQQQAPASQESAPAAEPGAAGTAPAAEPEVAPAEPAPAEQAPAATEQPPAEAAPAEPAPATEEAPAEPAPAAEPGATPAPAEAAPAEPAPSELIPLPNNETTTEPAQEPGASGN